jgi:Uroporphyrinogen-III synthase
MHILLTRPIEDCQNLIVRFTNLGHTVSHLPVIKIKKKKYSSINFSEYSCLIFTSSNAVKNLNLEEINKNINCFCVGSATKKIARSFGFQNVFSADGNVNNLKELILQNVNSKDSKLLYVSGEIVSSNLDQDLIKEGFTINRIVNYFVEPIYTLDVDFVEKLKKNIPEIVFIYSQNSGYNFLNLINKYELVDYWMNTNLMCIGEKTSSVLNKIKWKKIYLFSPGEEEFLLNRL